MSRNQANTPFGPKKPLLPRLITASAITVLAYLLSLLFTQPFSFSAGTMLSSADKRDFNLTDFYNIVADSRPIRTLDPEIVIVDIAGTEREDVTDIIEILADMNPRAVGLDVTFNDRRPGDERLLAALDRCPNLIMAVGVSNVPEQRDTFVVDDYSYFCHGHCDSHRHGVVNFPTSFNGATIRSFLPAYPCRSGEEVPSLALALAEIADPASAALLKSRGNDMEAIDFPSREFNIIPCKELPDRPNEISGKIVLVGAIGELGDVHSTPINNRMAGVTIHAHTLNTILQDNYYHVAGRWLNMLISFICCFLLCFSNLSYLSPARGLWMRIIQLGGLYCIIRIGYYLFIDRHVIVDFSYTLMMLTFGFFALDIWIGITYYGKRLLEKITGKTKSHS